MNLINNFTSVHYNPSHYSNSSTIKHTKPSIQTFTLTPQIYVATNTYSLGSITLEAGTYLVNVQYAFQGIFSAVGSITSCALCISSNSTFSKIGQLLYLQGPALQTNVIKTIYNFGINGSGIITITNPTIIYLNAFCYYTGTALIQNQNGNLGNITFLKL